MPAPRPASSAACACYRRTAGGVHLIHQSRIEPKGGEICGISLDHLAQQRGAVARGKLRHLVEGGDGVGQRAQQRRCQPPGAGHGVEQIRLGEALHLQHVLHRRARPVEFQPARGGTGDGADTAVELRRGAAVERKLGLAIGLAPGQGGIVDIGKAHGALELVGGVRVQKDDGDMCLRPGLGPLGEKGDNLVLLSHVPSRAGSWRQARPAWRPRSSRPSATPLPPRAARAYSPAKWRGSG